MALRIALVVATGVAGAVGVTAPQGSFGEGRTRYREAQRAERPITLSFRRASVGDVIKRLSREGVSFVVADEELPRDKKITINIVRQPMSDAMAALGAALGGHWDRRGTIYVFRKGIFFTPAVQGNGKLDISKFEKLRTRLRGAKKTPLSPTPPALAPSTSDKCTGTKRPSRPKSAPEPMQIVVGGVVGLAETLSEEQREKERHQGFLSWEDLTPAQQRMLIPDPMESGDVTHIGGLGLK